MLASPTNKWQCSSPSCKESYLECSIHQAKVLVPPIVGLGRFTRERESQTTREGSLILRESRGATIRNKELCSHTLRPAESRGVITDL